MGSILFNILWIVLHNNVYLILWEQPLWRAPDIRMNRLSAACWCRVVCLARPGHWVTMSRLRSRQVTWQRLRHADASPPCHSQSRISSFKQTPTLFDSGNSAVSRDISAQFKSEWLQLVFRKLHCCVSNLRNLSIASIYVTVSVRHEAAQAGLAWGQLQLWILSQVRVTLSPHYSLTWPHHWSLKHCQSWWFRRTLFTFIHYLCTPQNVLFFCFF